MTTPEVRITLRLPAPLHERLKAAAARERRSLNAQIAVYVERGLDVDGQGEDHGG
jgi:predicted HicB family RNase H-like nuclease